MNKKPDDKIVKLNFDTDKHDSKVEASKLSDEQRALLPKQRKIKKRIYNFYQNWVKNVKSKPRTRPDLIAATYQLQSAIGGFTKDCKDCGLEEWHAFSMQSIEDKIATMVATDITERNEITSFIPDRPTLMDEDNDAIVSRDLKDRARPTVFRTMEELEAIPFVASAKTKLGFIGFCLFGNGLVAVYNDGMVAEIGFLANGKGVEKYPTLQDFDAALSAPHTLPPDAGTAPGSADPAADASGTPTAGGTPGPTE